MTSITAADLVEVLAIQEDRISDLEAQLADALRELAFATDNITALLDRERRRFAHTAFEFNSSRKAFVEASEHMDEVDPVKVFARGRFGDS